MLKRLFALLALFSCALISSAGWQDNITMLIIPREAQPVKLAMEISKQYPTLIVCYQKAGNEYKLHAWNGRAWVKISPTSYRIGSFCQHPPSNAVLIDSKENPVPSSLLPNTAWCPLSYRLNSTDISVMVYHLGRHFDFPYHTWTLYAEKYNKPLNVINPGFYNIPWYHYRGEQLADRKALVDTSLHMDKWIPTLRVSPGQDFALEELTRSPKAQPRRVKPVPAPKPVVEEAPTVHGLEITDLEVHEARDVEILEVPLDVPEPAKPVEEVRIPADPFSNYDIPVATVIEVPAKK